ncbi:LOW QUALITY PROTEIN: hypothetical protein ACHAXT_008086 [Thalassiosira profunda]
MADPAKNVEYLALTEDSPPTANLLLDLEAKKRASTVDVPTLPADVRDALRNLGEPIRLFGEDLAAIRDRLRMVLARWEVWREQQEQGLVDGQMQLPPMEGEGMGAEAALAEEVTETTYTHATPELGAASVGEERQRRRGMVRWTRSKKRARLFDKEEDENEADNAGSLYCDEGLKEEAALMKDLDDNCEKIYKSVRNQALEGSQYGDVRPLSAVCTSSVSAGNEEAVGKFPKLIATGGWSGGIKIWNGGDQSSDVDAAPLDLLGAKNIVHEDRIMGIAMQPFVSAPTATDPLTIVGTASIDLTAKTVTINEEAVADGDAMEVENLNPEDQKLRYNIEECAHLKGHAAPWHFTPLANFVATTSFDHTWRLWDVETSSMAEGKELLLQDGHAREVYGVGFHPDGSLVATTDFGGVVQCWDLRTGKSACHFLGHAKRVICSEFSPNGFQLATAGDDGTIKIWDLRRRRPSASIPAHTNLITQLKFAHSSTSQNGEFLASSSFDGTGKVWSTRDWKLLTSLQGHEGKGHGHRRAGWSQMWRGDLRL